MNATQHTVQEALKKIRMNKQRLSTQQMRTLKGQVLAGDIAGAMRGLDKLIDKMNCGGDS